MVPNQFAREPIKQLGMRRRGAMPTEIVRGFDQGGAEMELPQPIRHDARGEGMVGAGDPVCERPPSRLLG